MTRKTWPTLALLTVGLIQSAPIVGVSGSRALLQLYGVPFDGRPELLLMQHRALLLALVGVLILVSTWRANLQPVAITLGIASMLSYLLLVAAGGAITSEMARVAWIDVLALILLLYAGWSALERKRMSR